MSKRVVHTGGGQFITVNNKRRTAADLEYEKWRRQREFDEQSWPGITDARALATEVLEKLWGESADTMAAYPDISRLAVRQALTERGLEDLCK